MEGKNHTGHRERLKQKFKENGSSLTDAELLELLLFFAIPRRDTKNSAEKLLERYGNLEKVVGAPPDVLLAQSGVGQNTALLLGVQSELMRRCAGARNTAVNSKPNHALEKLASSRAAARYAEKILSDKQNEQLYLIGLDSDFSIRGTYLLAEGDLTRIPLSVRTVAERMAASGASKMILSHNHPNGECRPSRQDIRATEKILAVCKLLEISFVDHIIVGEDGIFSFAEKAKLPDRYEPQAGTEF